ncbi:YXWGXW repeat-containing protein [Desulfatirhabdium butyrativorans]|uniref:YXWGXW repeat-containing protein n=1 Tax=Desulfatirhabdium butyrativorans TaxID=340467 RepID=UPI0012EBDD53|nr:YXWGXW repeat-containing protein [Desulfatirhabdium butyrativorans]
MRNFLAILCLGAMAASSAFAASNVGFDVHINVGGPPVVVAPAPPPPPVMPPPPTPPPPPPQVVFQQAPAFIMPPGLGFYVGVDVPYDIVFMSGRYYLYQGNYWYSAPSYNGPWNAIPHGRLPPVLRKHKPEEIRYYRDHEYRGIHPERHPDMRPRPDRDYRQPQPPPRPPQVDRRQPPPPPGPPRGDHRQPSFPPGQRDYKQPSPPPAPPHGNTRQHPAPPRPPGDQRQMGDDPGRFIQNDAGH